MTMTRGVWILSVGLLLAACGGDEAVVEAGPVVSDSAGVRIVENPAETAAIGWTVGSEPLFRIGADDPDDGLFGVRAAVSTSDGGLVIANSGTHEMRFYDAQGNHVRSVGREGDGPGEFRMLGRLVRYRGDSLMTFDQRIRRLAIMGPDGEHGRVVNLVPDEESRGVGSPVGVFADGSFLAQGFADTEGQSFDGLRAFASPLFRFGADGEALSAFGSFTGGQSYFVPFANGGFSIYPYYFSRSSTSMALDDRMVYAYSDAFDVRYYGLDGSLEMRVRRAGAPRVPTTAELARFESEQIEAARTDERATQMRNLFSEMDPPATMPAHGRVVSGIDGRVWVERYRAFDDEPSRFDVIDRDGTILGYVDMPPMERILEVGADRMIVLERDEFDVESVAVYPLRRSSP